MDLLIPERPPQYCFYVVSSYISMKDCGLQALWLYRQQYCSHLHETGKITGKRLNQKDFGLVSHEVYEKGRNIDSNDTYIGNSIQVLLSFESFDTRFVLGSLCGK